MMNCLMCLLIFFGNAPQEPLRTEIAICDFGIPRSVKQANANFSLSYSFQLDDEGRPAKIVKLRDRHARKEAVESCLRGWRFAGLAPRTQLVAIFRWQHGKGWVEIVISGKNFNQVVRIADGVGY